MWSSHSWRNTDQSAGLAPDSKVQDWPLTESFQGSQGPIILVSYATKLWSTPPSKISEVSALERYKHLFALAFFFLLDFFFYFDSYFNNQVGFIHHSLHSCFNVCLFFFNLKNLVLVLSLQYYEMAVKASI